MDEVMFKTSKCKISKKGKIQIPKELLKSLGEDRNALISYDEENGTIIISTSKDKKKRKTTLKKYTNFDIKEKNFSNGPVKIIIGDEVAYNADDIWCGLFLYDGQIYYKKLVKSVSMFSEKMWSPRSYLISGSPDQTTSFKSIMTKRLTGLIDNSEIGDTINKTMVHPITIEFDFKNLNKDKEGIKYEKSAENNKETVPEEWILL